MVCLHHRSAHGPVRLTDIQQHHHPALSSYTAAGAQAIRLLLLPTTLSPRPCVITNVTCSTAYAHAKADRMLTQARNHCAQLLSEARVTAQDMVNQARTRVETMVSDARTTAETLQRQSEDKAASLAQDAARQQAEILDALRQDKSLLENAIEDLRGFEQKYRTQLVTYLQSLLHELGGPEFAAPADPISAPAGPGGLRVGRAVKPVNHRSGHDE